MGPQATIHVPESGPIPESGAPVAPTAKGAAQRYYRPELDWLRLLAFTTVFWFHALPYDTPQLVGMGMPEPLAAYVFAPMLRAGGHGVVLFFVLSSFLISELLIRERERTGTVHVKWFYVRRILRIWPLYFLLLALAAPAEHFLFGHPVSFFASMFVFGLNWYVAYVREYMSHTSHLWTVSIEEQFYLVWPHVVRHARPRRFVLLMLAMYAVAFAYRTVYVSLCPADPNLAVVVRCNTLMRLDMFALGGLLACLFHYRPFTLPPVSRVTLLLIAFLLYWIVGMEPSGGYQGAATLWSYPVLGVSSVLCLAAFLAAPPLVRMAWPLRVCTYLGKISYGLYMWHHPAILLSYRILPNGPELEAGPVASRCLLAAVLTLVVSIASYELFEKPFLRLKRRFTFVESRPA